MRVWGEGRRTKANCQTIFSPTVGEQSNGHFKINQKFSLNDSAEKINLGKSLFSLLIAWNRSFCFQRLASVVEGQLAFDRDTLIGLDLSLYGHFSFGKYSLVRKISSPYT